MSEIAVAKPYVIWDSSRFVLVFARWWSWSCRRGGRLHSKNSRSSPHSSHWGLDHERSHFSRFSGIVSLFALGCFYSFVIIIYVILSIVRFFPFSVSYLFYEWWIIAGAAVCISATGRYFCSGVALLSFVLVLACEPMAARIQNYFLRCSSVSYLKSSSDVFARSASIQV